MGTRFGQRRRSRMTTVISSTVAAILLITAGALAFAPAGSAVTGETATNADSGSAVTLSGTGEFSSLRVTVSQTRNLINQIIQINWTGGTPTVPAAGRFDTDFLQIMQCWGDDPSGPDRTQCQYGGLAGIDQRGGSTITNRTVDSTDPAETLAEPGEFVGVPFSAANGETVVSGKNQFFDSNTTNEIPFARTRSDGAGQEFFETQTVREAPGLRCGEPTGDGPRSCWLVIVPRGATEADGSQAGFNDALESSPLSASNWANRIVVPLEFVLIGDVCPIGGAERRMLGHELIAEAVTRWQPALCADGGAIYGFSRVSDDIARRNIVSDDPQMGIVSTPVAPDQVPDDRKLVYAPISIAGLSFSFLVESQSSIFSSPDVQARDGIRLTSMKLTPRLVAKLLTQSYVCAVHCTVTTLGNNPPGMLKDPEFLALNPEYAALSFPQDSLSELLLPFGRSDAIAQVWEWIQADPEARAFIAGRADPNGMRVNPNYRGMQLPRQDFPKSDPFCYQPDDVRIPPLCGLDQHPYANDMSEAARSASRGDSLSRSTWDPLALPPAWKKSTPQLSGKRVLIAVTDSALTDRYGLTAAKVKNAKGAFVAPTERSLVAGVNSFTASPVPGVRTYNPRPTSAAAYPLATVSYAMLAPAKMDSAAGKDYADFIRYAVGDGQVVGVSEGQLPEGYAPLPSSLRAAARIQANVVQQTAGKPVTPTPTPTATASPSPTASPTASPTGTPTDGGGGGFPTFVPTDSNTGGPTVEPTDSPSPTTASPSGSPTRSPSPSPSPPSRSPPRACFAAR